MKIFYQVCLQALEPFPVYYYYYDVKATLGGNCLLFKSSKLC